MTEIWIRGKSIEYLHQYLSVPDEAKCICAVGSGGKTSLLYRLAREYRAEGKRVLLCTTTKMFVPKRDFVSGDCAAAIREKLKRDGFAVAGTILKNTVPQQERLKFSALPEPVWNDVYEAAEKVLVEADGSRRLPLKMPGAKEPSLPDPCAFVIAVSGLSGIGKKLAEVCHRAELAEEVLHTDGTHIVTETDAVRLLLAGYETYLQKKNGCFYFNQADCVTTQQLANVKTAMRENDFFAGSLRQD